MSNNRTFKILKISMLLKVVRGIPKEHSNEVFAVFAITAKRLCTSRDLPSDDDLFMYKVADRIQKHVDKCDCHGMEELKSELESFCEYEGWWLEQLPMFDLSTPLSKITRPNSKR